jgi:hypothetical protein
MSELIREYPAHFFD